MRNKNSFLLASTGLSLAIAGGVFGVQSNQAAQQFRTSSLPPVTLNMLLVSPQVPDDAAVYKQVNRILKQKINTTLNVTFLDWNNYKQQYPLIFASHQDMDIAYSASWMNYAQEAIQGAFAPISLSQIKKYMPATYKTQPAAAWQQAKVNGKIYMIPNNVEQSKYGLVLVRGDLLKKYHLGPITSLKGYDTYLADVAKNDPSITPSLGAGSNGTAQAELYQPNNWSLNAIVAGLTYKVTNGSYKVFDVLKTPQFLAWAKTTRAAEQKGEWRPDAITSQMDETQGFEDGQLASVTWNASALTTIEQQVAKAHPSWDPEIVDLSSGAKREMSAYIQNGVSIAATSKYVNRDLMVLDLLRNDKQLYDLTHYGLKGKEWTPAGKHFYKLLPDTKLYPVDQEGQWGWFNQPLQRIVVGSAQTDMNMYNSWLKNGLIVSDKLAGFPLNTTDANAAKFTALTTIWNEYYKEISFGLVDPIQAIAQLEQKLNAVGYKQVQQDVQNQVNKYLKSNS